MITRLGTNRAERKATSSMYQCHYAKPKRHSNHQNAQERVTPLFITFFLRGASFAIADQFYVRYLQQPPKSFIDVDDLPAS